MLRATEVGHAGKKYAHAVIVSDCGNKCEWKGLGHQGCDHGCEIWKNRFTMDTDIMHEFGHNIKLRHAETPTDAYGDRNSVMGAAKSPVMFNAWQYICLGWSSYYYIDEASLRGWGTFDIELRSLEQTPLGHAVCLRMGELANPNDLEKQDYWIISMRTSDHYGKNLVGFAKYVADQPIQALIEIHKASKNYIRKKQSNVTVYKGGWVPGSVKMGVINNVNNKMDFPGFSVTWKSDHLAPTNIWVNTPTNKIDGHRAVITITSR
jgi:hypothetical protein